VGLCGVTLDTVHDSSQRRRWMRKGLHEVEDIGFRLFDSWYELPSLREDRLCIARFGIAVNLSDLRAVLSEWIPCSGSAVLKKLPVGAEGPEGCSCNIDA